MAAISRVSLRTPGRYILNGRAATREELEHYLALSAEISPTPGFQLSFGSEIRFDEVLDLMAAVRGVDLVARGAGTTAEDVAREGPAFMIIAGTRPFGEALATGAPLAASGGGE